MKLTSNSGGDSRSAVCTNPPAETSVALPSSLIGRDPWKNRGVWCFAVTEVGARRRPFTHNAFAEKVDTAGNYRGRELGPFYSLSRATRAVANFREQSAPV